MNQQNFEQIDYNEYLELVEKNRALEAAYELYNIILSSLDFEVMAQKIADIIPQKLGYETGVLALVNEETQTLNRIAISMTSGGFAALKYLQIPFENIVIPLDYETNTCIKALKTGEQQISDSLYDVIKPSVSKENAIKVQEAMNTKISIVTPLTKGEKRIGIFIISMSKDVREVTDFEKNIIKKFSQGVGIAIENAKLYEKLKKAYAKLQLLDKQKDEFLSVASHELRTPMTIIKSYLWMLSQGKGGSLTNKQHEYINKAMNGTERMLNLINDMLHISRYEQGRMQFTVKLLDTKKISHEILNDFIIKAKEQNIYFKTEIADDVKAIYSDKAKFDEILMNLIGNALKFTSEGGITVKAYNLNHKFVKFEVIDTGKGISLDDQKRLFHKFGRLDNSYQTVAESGGTGLGLYISKKLVETLGGEIGLHSEGIGKGTVFWFTLPTEKIHVTEEFYHQEPEVKEQENNISEAIDYSKKDISDK